MIKASATEKHLARIAELEAELAFYKEAYKSALSNDSGEHTKTNRNSGDLNALISSLQDIVFEIDQSDRILNVWTLDESLLFISKDKFLGKTITEATYGLFGNLFEKVLNQVRITHSTQRIEYPSPEPSKWWSAMFSPIIVDGIQSGKVVCVIRDITELKQTQHALQQSERRLRQIIDLVPHFIFAKDAEGKFLLVNEAIANAYGTTIENLLGKTDADFNPAKAEVNQFLQADSDVIKSGKSKLIPEENFTDSAGNKRILRTIKIPFKLIEGSDAVLGVSTEITEQKRYEEALIDSEERLKLAMESAKEGLWDWNLETSEVFASEDIYKILEYDPPGPENQGLNWMELIHPEDYERVRNIFTSDIPSPGYLHCEYRLKSYKSGWIWVLNKSRIFRREFTGKATRVIGIITDITERRINEKALQESERQLKEQNEEYQSINEILNDTNQRILEINLELLLAKEKAEESDHLKSAFLANISHEIRTPMNGILGFSELLKNSNITDEQFETYVNIINVNGQQLLSIIDDVIDISKIEAGQIKITNKETMISELLDNLYNFYLPAISEKKLKFIVRSELPAQASIYTDPVRLKQILNNLISNAIKFTSEGQIEVIVRHDNKNCLFSVRDTGIGISSENFGLIFERFRQIESGNSRQYGGTGLGLSISKSLVNILGGKIWVESSPNKGSDFIFAIPFNTKISGMTELDSDLPSSPLPETEDEKLVIMIAEDEESNYLYLKELLSSYPVTLIRARNGKEAIEIVRAGQRINLILMDIKMPLIDGYEAATEIKKINSNIPIIAQTAYAMSDDKNKALKSGCDDYISKPIRKDILMEKIQIFIPIEGTSLK